MDLHASNESLIVSKDVNFSLLFYLTNISLGKQIFDDFNAVVAIIIKICQGFDRGQCHQRYQAKLGFQKDQDSQIYAHFIHNSMHLFSFGDLHTGESTDYNYLCYHNMPGLFQIHQHFAMTATVNLYPREFHWLVSHLKITTTTSGMMQILEKM